MLFDSLGQGQVLGGSSWPLTGKRNTTRVIVSWSSANRDWPFKSHLDYDPFKVDLPNQIGGSTSSSSKPTRIITSINLTTQPNQVSGWLNDSNSFQVTRPSEIDYLSTSLATSTQVSTNPSPTKIQILTTTVTKPSLPEGGFVTLDTTTPVTFSASMQSNPIRIELPKEVQKPSYDFAATTTTTTSTTTTTTRPAELSSTSDTNQHRDTTRPTISPPSSTLKPNALPSNAFQAQTSKNVTDTIIAQLQKDNYNHLNSSFHSNMSFFDKHQNDMTSFLNGTTDLLKPDSSYFNITITGFDKTRHTNNGSAGSINQTSNSTKPTGKVTTKLPRLTTTRVPNSSSTKTPGRNSTRVRTPNSAISSKRPSTKADISLSDELLSQYHHVTTQKPYIAKRDCGIRTMKREGRVVGGRDSHLGEFPWSVLIRETTLLGFFIKTKCGGVLIDLKWVLTAAHCQPGMFGSLIVVVGEYDLQGKSSRLKPIIRKVKRMIIHRDYNPANFDNDIALLELESPYQVQPHVVPICLPEKGKYV